MASLLAGVRYRIQNVDSGTFLELSDKSLETEVKTRPAKFSEKQLWTIVADPREPDVFMLENVGQKTWMGLLTDGDKFSQLIGQSRASASRWCLDPDDGDSFWISFARTKKPRCLELGEFGAVLAAKRAAKDSDSQKWRFLTERQAYQLTAPKETGSLSPGIYRIRSLDGTVFISLTDSNVEVEPRSKHTGALAYSASTDEVVKSQKWLVTCFDDGTYSIQDSEQHLFLGCDCYKYGPIHGFRDPFAWDIHPVGGGFAYTINIQSVSDLLCIGFRDYQAGVRKELALMPAMSAHSQTWFFEPWDESAEISTLPEDPPIASSSTQERRAASPAIPTPADPGPGSAGAPSTRFPRDNSSLLRTYFGFGDDAMDDIGSPPACDESDSDGEEEEEVMLNGHYHIRNVGSGKYLNIGTNVFFSSEPTHAPSRFFVRMREPNEAQITPHSHVGQQSLVWRNSKSSLIVVEDEAKPAWLLVKVDDGERHRFQLSPGLGYVLAVVENEVKLVKREPDDEDPFLMWDFVIIY